MISFVFVFVFFFFFYSGFARLKMLYSYYKELESKTSQFQKEWIFFIAFFISKFEIEMQQTRTVLKTKKCSKSHFFSSFFCVSRCFIDEHHK